MDTNVVYPALVEGMPRHNGMDVLKLACTESGASLWVSDLTIEELARSIAIQIEDMRRVETSIPESSIVWARVSILLTFPSSSLCFTKLVPPRR